MRSGPGPFNRSWTCYRRWRKVGRCSLFTNTNVTHHTAWSSLYARILQPFERIFLSCSMGLRKPEAEAFAAIANDIGVPLERILFFDDTEQNVAGARAVGMPAVWVRSPSDVVEAVMPYLEKGR